MIKLECWNIHAYFNGSELISAAYKIEDMLYQVCKVCPFRGTRAAIVQRQKLNGQGAMQGIIY